MFSNGSKYLNDHQMEPWHVLLLIVALVSLNYISRLLEDKFKRMTYSSDDTMEGFAGEAASEAGASTENHGVIRWLDNNELYDPFYCSVYDQLTQGAIRNQAEVGLMLHEWTKKGEDLKTFNVLDVGCGTGIAVCAFAKMGVKRIVGLDKSQAMIDQASKKVVAQTTLTEEQKDVIVWKRDDAINPSAFAGGEFDHICMLYFTVYYFADKEGLFRNLFYWAKPGARLVVQVVNKHKFDPMLDSASPWMGFSLQKYSDTRIVKSEVVFNKFKYAGQFHLTDPEAEFRETFRFTSASASSSAKIRRQKHTLIMEDMTEIVGMAKLAGWEYVGNIDLTPISFEYAYHLHFVRR